MNGLVRGICGEFDLPAAVAAAPLKVRVDSDQPISSVALACPGLSDSETLSGSDTIARFDAVAGTCTVTLGGVVDMAVEVEVPETGRDLRCTVRAGRVHCG